MLCGTTRTICEEYYLVTRSGAASFVHSGVGLRIEVASAVLYQIQVGASVVPFSQLVLHYRVVAFVVETERVGT